jgi:hypothetical protein
MMRSERAATVPHAEDSIVMPRRLEARHLADLAASGITEEFALQNGCFSGSVEQVKAILGFNPTNSPGLVFSYPGTNGNGQKPFMRVKPDVPPVIDGKPAKYLSPKGAANRLYVPRGVELAFKDPSISLYIVEGEKKALKTALERLMCIALAGVWCWKTKGDDGQSRPIPDLDRIEWVGRAAYIVFDSDAVQNPKVRDAEQALAKELRGRGAVVRVIRLPGTEQKKVGLDDYLLTHTVQEFLQLPHEDPFRDVDFVSATTPPPADTWPVLDPAALHGLAGDVVRLLEPHTESDPVALLASFLAEVGTMLNRGPHLILDGTYHPLLFWPVLVGQSSKARKGTAGKRIERVCALADSEWHRGECKGTLSSGEGLVFAVRDPQYREEPLKDHGRPTGETVRVCIDSGIEDKRLFIPQAEFGAMLRVMARDGNSLSGVLRDAWDGLTLAPMTKANRVKATDPHVGLVGHVTKEELLRNLTDTECANGFGNRFVWLAVKRSKMLPFGADPDETALHTLAVGVGKAIRCGRTIGRTELTDAFCEAWKEVYPVLSEGQPGLAGSLLGRAEAQTMRLSALYAVLDGTGKIDAVHLEAALALWDYAEASTKLIFGDSTGDPVADTILRAVRTGGELSDSEISSLFGRNISASRLERAKVALLSAGLLQRRTDPGSGRPRTVWLSVTK